MLFKSKIITGVLAGGFTLGAAGLLFTGTDTLEKASDFVRDAGGKISQYEQNENALLEKIGLLQTDASGKIQEANATIEDLNVQIDNLDRQKTSLEENIEDLKTEITNLNTDIAALEKFLEDEKDAHNITKEELETAQANYDEAIRSLEAKEAELEEANNQLAAITEERNTLQQTLEYAVVKAEEGDKLIEDLEGEVQKANQQVEAHGNIVDQVESDTADDQPLTEEEIESIPTEIDDVVEK